MHPAVQAHRTVGFRAKYEWLADSANLLGMAGRSDRAFRRRRADTGEEMKVPLTENFTTAWWRMILPRVFGRRMVHTDDGCTVTMYLWRGNFYVAKVQHTSMLESQPLFPLQ
jgi:hypothetical protein